MTTEIRENKSFPTGYCYDLFVNGKLEVEAESMQVVSNIQESLTSNSFGTEADEIAEVIRDNQ